MKCKTCGASIENTANRSSYKCEYCGSYNYDEKYIEKRFESLNLTKANEVLNIAQLRYKSGRYDEAIELITESLKENNDCVEAWGILASCRINTLNTGNFDKNLISIEECMIKIKNLDPDSSKDFFVEIHEKLLAKTLIISTEHINKSSKVYDAYASTDKNRAIDSAVKYSLLAISMITNAHKINQEFTEPSIKASIYILFTIFSKEEIVNDPRFLEYKENSQKIVQDAIEKNVESTNQLIKSIGLDPNTIKRYLKNKMTKDTNKISKGRYFLYFIIIFIVIIIFRSLSDS